jgi:hypothetical protein
VRFLTADGALKAVAELNKWQLHGSRIIVDIVRDTGERIKQGQIYLLYHTITKKCIAFLLI